MHPLVFMKKKKIIQNHTNSKKVTQFLPAHVTSITQVTLEHSIFMRITFKHN